MSILLAFAFLLTAGCGPSAPRSNVVVVVIDTLRQDHLAPYGYSRDTAPFLSELAREGAVFDGLSTSSWTKPATASLLTGLHPLRHQTFARRDRLPPQAVVLAERLRQGGYRTIAASANGWVSPAFGFDRGFDTFFLAEDLSAEGLNRRLFPLLAGLQAPFFLYVHYVDPHVPYAPATAWDGSPLPAELKADGPMDLSELDATHEYPRPPEFLARTRDLYDGEIRGADQGLRELVSWLHRRGLMKNTLLVVTSDHGEELGEHGRMSHGQSLYQEVVEVPLVFHGPHLMRSGRHFGRASLLDVVPTVADLAGISIPSEEIDGVSLAGLLAGGRGSDGNERAFLFHLDFKDGTSIAVLRGPKKLVLSKVPYRKELFGLDRDPGERHNLVNGSGGGEFASVAAELAERYNSYARGALLRTTVSMDDELMKRLAALGYITSNAEPDPRRIPGRVAPPDPLPRGLLGWETATSEDRCLRLGEVAAASSLLEGWYWAELGGRWSAQDGTLALPLAATLRGAFSLKLSGANYGPRPVHLRVRVDDRGVLDTTVAPGGFEIAGPIAELPRKGPLFVEVAADPAFVPAEEGMGEDRRSLGIFLSSVCLEPRSGA